MVIAVKWFVFLEMALETIKERLLGVIGYCCSTTFVLDLGLLR